MGMRTMLNAWGRIASPSQRKLREHYASVCTDVIVNLNDGNKPKGKPWPRWHTFRPLRDYRDAFAHFRDLGVTPHVMTWVSSDPAWLDPMLDATLELAHMGAASVLTDAEEVWAGRFAPGVRRWQRRQVRDEAAKRIDDTFRDNGIVWGVTEVPMRSKGVIKPLYTRADYVMPQAHTFGARYDDKGRPKKHHRFKVPGWLEEWTHKVWSARLRDGQRLIPHLADYHVGSYRQTESGLRESIETCRDLGYTEVAAWTGIAGPKHPDVWRALKGAA